MSGTLVELELCHYVTFFFFPPPYLFFPLSFDSPLFVPTNLFWEFASDFLILLI